MRPQFDVLIIGAGPAGSSAAILLARAGWSVALIEKQRFPRRKVCGECIAASNLPLLTALGLGPALQQFAGPELRQVALMRGANTVVADLVAADHDEFRWGRALGREMLDTLLVEQARAVGVQVLQPWSVQSIDGGPGAWHCDIRAADALSAQTLHAAVAIDAHGSWETLPWDRPQRRLARQAADLFAFKANFLDASLDEGLLPVLSFDGGYGGMVVADNGVTTVAGCIRRDHLENLRRATPGQSAGESVKVMLQRECVGARQVMQNASRQGPWLAAGPLNPGIRLQPNDGLFRIGNAAGEAHPIIGEGISMAMQSAWLLCAQLLDREQAVDGQGVSNRSWQRAVANRYASEWRRQFAPRMRLASVVAHAAMHPNSAAIMMTLTKTWPTLLPLGAKWGGKTRCAIDPATIALLTSLPMSI